MKFFVSVLPLIAASTVLVHGQTSSGPKQYYLSLGDSLARGYQPNGDTTHGFADQFYSYLQTKGVPNYINYGCSGETSTTFINGGCPLWNQVRNGYGQTPQLTAALSFINSRPSQVSPVTLDIGANDALSYFNPSTCAVSATWQSDLSGFDTRLRSILSQLKTALNGTGDLFLMNYYNPYQNQCAGTSVGTVFATFNTTIQNAAFDYGVPVADVFSAFGGAAPPNPFLSTYSWITTLGDIHPTTTGYGVIAQAFEFNACYATGDFCFSINPANQQTIPGSSNTFTLNLNPGHGFAGSVSFANFTLTGSNPPSGVTAFLPAPIALTGPASAVMTVAVAPGIPNGTYGFSVNSQSASLTHLASSQIMSVVPQYTISIAPSVATVVPGSAASYSVSIAPSGTFSGAVSVSLMNSPAGVSAAPLTVAAGSSGTLVVSTASNTTAGNYTLGITTAPVTGGATQNSTVQLNVQPPDYTLSAAPSSLTVTAGASAPYTASVTPVSGFASSVLVSLATPPAGVSAAPITVSPGMSGPLTVGTKPCTVGGDYALTLTGTVSGGPTHSTSVNLSVNAAANPIYYKVSGGLPADTTAMFSTPPSVKGDFSLQASPGSLTVYRGYSNLFGIVDIAADGSGSTSSPVKISASATAVPGTYFLSLQGASCSYKHSTAILLTIK